MLKKIITTTVLGSSLLGMMAANAAESGVYVTGELGYAKSGLNAAAPQIPGLTGLSGSKSTLGIPSVASGKHLSNGLAERLALGYKINNNAAFEVGFLHLDNGSVNGSIKVNPSILGIAQQSITSNVSTKQYAMDVAAKGIIPVSQNFNVYGKVGVAYLTTHTKGNTQTQNTPVYPDAKKVISGVANMDITQRNWAPEVAVGVSYDLTSNVSIDASVTHIHPVGSHKPGNINFATVGLGYSFG